MTQPKRKKDESAELVKLFRSVMPGDFAKVLENSIQRYAFSLIFSNRITIFSIRRFCWPAISRLFQNDITIFSNGISRFFQTDFLSQISGTD